MRGLTMVPVISPKVEACSGVSRVGKLRMVGQIEEFRPELDGLLFPEPVVLMIEASKLTWPGPRKMPWPALPNSVAPSGPIAGGAENGGIEVLKAGERTVSHDRVRFDSTRVLDLPVRDAGSDLSRGAAALARAAVGPP